MVKRTKCTVGEKRDAVLICQGASRVQVRRGAAGPGEKKMKRIHMRMSGIESLGREVGCANESWIGNDMIVMHDL